MRVYDVKVQPDHIQKYGKGLGKYQCIVTDIRRRDYEVEYE